MFGREAQVPLDLLCDPVSSADKSELVIPNYIKNLRNTMMNTPFTQVCQ